MKQNFYKITASNRFQTVIAFLRKELGWKQSDAMVCSPLYALEYGADIASETVQFLYINSSFSPAPDDTVANLYKVAFALASFRKSQLIATCLRDQCFATEGHLIVNYRYALRCLPPVDSTTDGQSLQLNSSLGLDFTL
jgi:hypothetical protein